MLREASPRNISVIPESEWSFAQHDSGSNAPASHGLALLPRYTNNQRHPIERDRLCIGIATRRAERQRCGQRLGLDVLAPFRQHLAEVAAPVELERDSIRERQAGALAHLLHRTHQVARLALAP